MTQLARSTQRTFDFTQSPDAQTITLTPVKAPGTPIDLSVGPNATVADVVAQINGRSDLPVFAAAVPVAGGGSRLVLSSRAVGESEDPGHATRRCPRRPSRRAPRRSGWCG